MGDSPTDRTVREGVYGKKERWGKRFVPVWHNIIIVHGESMSRRVEMGFLKDEFDIIFFRAVSRCALTLPPPCWAFAMLVVAFVASVLGRGSVSKD